MSFRLVACADPDCGLIHGISVVRTARSGRPVAGRMGAARGGEDALTRTPDERPLAVVGGPPSHHGRPTPSLPERRRRTHLRAAHPGVGRSRRLSGVLGEPQTTAPSG